MARRYDSADAKRRILAACARLFLENGYTNTKVAEILKTADVSAGSFQNIFHTKDGVLSEFVDIMFSGQFGKIRKLVVEAPSPAYIYATETALQLTLTEMNENLRDIYVEAYTYPGTLEIIHRRTTAELRAALPAGVRGERLLRDGAGHSRHDARLYGTEVRSVFHAGKKDSPLSGYEPERIPSARSGKGADSGLCGEDGRAHSCGAGHAGTVQVSGHAL